MLRVGLIGCGFMGSMHANCYKNLKGATITAVADLRDDKAHAIADELGAKIYKTGMELIEKEEFTAAPMDAYNNKIFCKGAPLKTAVIWNKDRIDPTR